MKIILFLLVLTIGSQNVEGCTRNSDCHPPFTICILGECDTNPLRHSYSHRYFMRKPCSTGADCDESSQCVDGKCKVMNGNGGACSGDAWCPDGYTCVDSTCQVVKRMFNKLCWPPFATDCF